MQPLYIPAITGQFAKWRYFQVIMSVEEIVRVIGYDKDKKPIYKIKTVDEVEEIYSRKGLSNMLQRVFDDKRLTPIRDYLIKQNDKYVNNITVATYGGEAEWQPIGIETHSYLEMDDSFSESYWEELGKSFGIIKLSGKETIFVLDGQHRIKGLREAYIEKPEIGKEQIALTLISHEPTPKGRQKTRRLFTVINRYAKPVSLGESILLDEDDLSAIIARALIEGYELFSKNELIALNKNANLNLPKDNLRLSTTIALWQINEKLIDPREVYPEFIGSKKDIVRIRPNDSEIEKYKKVVFDFWNLFFKTFPLANDFAKKPNEKYREDGGLFTLRPIGQVIFADYYMELKKLGKLNKLSNIKKVPERLDDKFWHNVLVEPVSGNIVGSSVYAKNYLFYMLGLPLKIRDREKLEKKYKEVSNNDKAKLPRPIITKI